MADGLPHKNVGAEADSLPCSISLSSASSCPAPKVLLYVVHTAHDIFLLRFSWPTSQEWRSGNAATTKIESLTFAGN